MTTRSVVIEIISEKDKKKATRVIVWDRNKEGNLEYKINTTERVRQMKENPALLASYFQALGLPSIFYHRETGRYSKHL